MKKILLIAATHGNEFIGLEVIEKLRFLLFDKYFDVLVANPRALMEGKRYLEADMNRSYPGNQNSKKYELRQAAVNLKIARKYKYVIDIHEASAGSNDFIIIPREKTGSKFPLDLVGMDKILLWPDPFGPLGSVLDNTIEIEFGSNNRNRQKMLETAVNIIKQFILGVNGVDINKQNRKIYRVYGKLMTGEYFEDLNRLKDFSAVKVGAEEFLPLLTGQYLSEGIVCYKMKELK